MGILDKLWNNHHGLNDPIHKALGMYPDRPPRPGFEQQHLQTAQETRGTAAAFAPIVRQRLSDIANEGGRVATARGVANADVMQSSGGGTPFERAMRRSSALSRVAMQGELAVRQQTLRDRIGMTRFGQGLRSGNARELGTMSMFQAEQTAGAMRRSQDSAATSANTLGTIAGAAGAWWNNYREQRNSGGAV